MGWNRPDSPRPCRLANRNATRQHVRRAFLSNGANRLPAGQEERSRTGPARVQQARKRARGEAAEAACREPAPPGAPVSGRLQLRAHQSLAFFNDDDAIRGDAPKPVHAPAGPAKSDLVHHDVAAKSEVQREIILREITHAAPDLINLALGAGADLGPRADTVAVGLAADGCDLNPVAGVAAIVAEQA